MGLLRSTAHSLWKLGCEIPPGLKIPVICPRQVQIRAREALCSPQILGREWTMNGLGCWTKKPGLSSVFGALGAKRIPLKTRAFRVWSGSSFVTVEINNYFHQNFE